MAADDLSVVDLLRPRSSTRTPLILPRVSKHGLRIGIVLVLIVVQVFFYIDSYLNSPLIPGDWSAYQTSFLVYLALDSISLGAIAALPQVLPKDEYGRFVIQPNGYRGFVFTYALFALAMWGAMVGYLAIFAVNGTHISPVLNDTARLQGFVFYGLFVGPSEELTFRVALPPYFSWVGSSLIVFPLFHLLAYTVGAAPASGVVLWVQIGIIAFWGLVFWVIFDRFGYGAAVAAHTVYDLCAAGILVSGVAIGALSIAVFPV